MCTGYMMFKWQGGACLKVTPIQHQVFSIVVLWSIERCVAHTLASKNQMTCRSTPFVLICCHCSGAGVGLRGICPASALFRGAILSGWLKHTIKSHSLSSVCTGDTKRRVFTFKMDHLQRGNIHVSSLNKKYFIVNQVEYEHLSVKFTFPVVTVPLYIHAALHHVQRCQLHSEAYSLPPSSTLWPTGYEPQNKAHWNH